ncbi:hypothetical protein EKO23_22220 [Nocardioides guangzhouensis]|uniref:Uncharacterized protein n=1 Tax=Nocardioides guangzhouensis TaxID=2497878 RepID=A0A4Q4Z4I7_9ACTN|nr:hypothetical protein [Nocardioides guangzhouensis]RYP82195.1 hypothetical protein EKO23_22220 [Nocardioides guangzhouensis]
MTTPELERRLVAVLQRHAEEAMNQTDTEHQFQKLAGATVRQKRNRRRAGAVAAMVAVAAVIVLVAWFSGQVPRAGEDGSPDPAGPERVSAVDSAEAFVETYATFDQARIAPLLDGAEIALWTDMYGDDHWQRGLGWRKAVGGQILPGDCAVLWRSPAGTEVSCTYDFHELHSDQYGVGPFGDNTLTFTIKDGQILEVTDKTAVSTNGYWPDVWDPFAAWLKRNHPDEAKRLYPTWPDTLYVNDTPRGLRLWRQLSQEYADQRSAGGP